MRASDRWAACGGARTQVEIIRMTSERLGVRAGPGPGINRPVDTINAKKMCETIGENDCGEAVRPDQAWRARKGALYETTRPSAGGRRCCHCPRVLQTAAVRKRNRAIIETQCAEDHTDLRYICETEPLNLR